MRLSSRKIKRKREYKEIADSCPIRNKEECSRSYSTLSEHSLCKWNNTEHHCESRNSMTPHFLLPAKYPSLESFYTDMEQPAVYQSAKKSWDEENRRIEERVVREQTEREEKEREERKQREVTLRRITEKQNESYEVNADDFNVDFSLGDDSFSFWPFGKKYKKYKKSNRKRNHKKRNLSKKRKK